MDRKNYITPTGAKRLQDELAHLRFVERPEVVKKVTWAASLGDRSENADYQYGKRRLKEIDSRIRFLGKRLEDAVIIDPSEGKFDCVKFGASVSVEDEEGKLIIFKIVGVDEVNVKERKISYLSPVGKGLLNKKRGDTVVIQTPTSEVSYEIKSIEYVTIE